MAAASVYLSIGILCTAASEIGNLCIMFILARVIKTTINTKTQFSMNARDKRNSKPTAMKMGTHPESLLLTILYTRRQPHVISNCLQRFRYTGLWKIYQTFLTRGKFP